MSAAFQEALRLSMLGWRTFPLAPGSKKPAIAGGKGHNDATTNAAQLSAWWPRNSKRNIGMVAPRGAYVLDVDTYKGNLDDLEARLLELHTPMQRTASGGLHVMFFGAPPDQTALRAKWGAGKGIEVKPPTGYVVVHPSVVAKSRYKWIVPPETPILVTPAWLVEGLDSVVVRDDAGTSANKMYLSGEQAAEMLLYLDHDWVAEYDAWLKVGMALHFEGDGGDEWLEVWNEWSRASVDNFEEGTCAKKWETFRADGTLTLWWVAKHARKNDWKQPPRHASAVADFAGVPLPVRPAESDDDFFASLDIPTVSDEMLYGPLRRIVEAATENSEATRSAVAASALVQFAARFGKALGTTVGDSDRTLVLYTLIVGPTGTGRKGTSGEFPRRLFELVDKLLEGGWGGGLLAECRRVPPLRVVTGVSSGQGLIDLVRDDGVAYHRGLEREVPGVEDKRLLLALSEFGQLFSAASQDASTLSMVIRDAFDGSVLDNPTRTNPLRATGAHLSILGHITMDEFRRKTIESKTSTEATNGLLNRFVVLFSRRDKLVSRPQPVPLAVRQALAAEIANNVHALFESNLSDHRSHRVVLLNFTDEAQALWDDAYKDVTSASYDSAMVAAIMGRRELHTRVIACLLAAMNGESAVGTGALRAALAWGKYGAESITKVFASIEQRRQGAQLARNVAKLRDRLSLAPNRSMKRRDIRNAFHNSAFKPELQDRTIAWMLNQAPPQLAWDPATKVLVLL